MAEVTLTIEEYNDLKSKADSWDSGEEKIIEVDREYKHCVSVFSMYDCEARTKDFHTDEEALKYLVDSNNSSLLAIRKGFEKDNETLRENLKNYINLKCYLEFNNSFFIKKSRLIDIINNK